MAKEFKQPEYIPYPSAPLYREAEVITDDYAPSKTELISDIEGYLETIESARSKLQDDISGGAVVSADNDPVLNEVMRDIWNVGTEIPLLLHQKLRYSENAKHQYLSNVVLDATRSITGNFNLDIDDIYDYAINEYKLLLEYLYQDNSCQTGQELTAITALADAIGVTFFKGVIHRQRGIVTEDLWPVSQYIADPVERAKQVQKHIHETLSKITGSVIQHKSTLIELKNSSSAFYNDKLAHLTTGYQSDINEMAQLLYSRAKLIEDTSLKLWKAIESGIALQEGWNEEAVVSKVSPRDVVQQGYVSSSPTNLAFGLDLLGLIQPVSTGILGDAEQIFIRKESYTKEDVEALVDMLNSLPENHTYIRAGIINVRSQHDFVEELLANINEMPPGSTLISGGMIALIGKDLTTFQGEVESGAYGNPDAYDDVQDVIDALNLSVGSFSGLTVLMPGIIGLTGDNIRDAVVSSINDIGPNSTLIGAGAIVITGDTSLADQAAAWDQSISTIEQNIEDLEEFSDGQIVGYYQPTEPTGTYGDIWIDTSSSPPTSADIYRYENATGGSSGTLAWRPAPTNAIGLVYLETYNALSTASSKITTFFQASAPTALATGDIWIDSDDNNKMYRWSGTAWEAVRDSGIAQALEDASQAIQDAADAQGTADGKVVTFFVASAPSAEAIGDLWIDTDDGNKLYRWSGTEWVVIQDTDIGDAIQAAADAQSTADGKIVTFIQDGPPTAEAVGDLWIDSNDDNRLYRWSGAIWVDVRDTGISNALSAAGAAQTTADGTINAFYNNTAPPSGMAFGDIWVDLDASPFNVDNAIYRYEDASHGSQGVLAWRLVQNNAIGKVYFSAYSAQTTADGKIKTFYQNGIPTSTDVGDLWIDTDDGNKLYRAASIGANEIKAGEWEAARDTAYTSKNVTFAQTGIPTSLAIGDMWVDTDDSNKLYRAASIGADQIIAGEWILVSDSTYTSKTQTFAQTGIPTSLAVGDLWVDTDDDNKLYRASSIGSDQIAVGEWVLVRDDGIADALGAASTAQETADGEIVGWYQASEPASGMTFGDIWIDTDDAPLDTSSIYRYEDAAGGSQGTLAWRAAATNAIGIIYLNAYSAQATADGKIKTFYQTGIPTSTGAGDLWIDTDDAKKLYRAAIVGANEIKTGEWEAAGDTAYTSMNKTFAQDGIPTSLAVGDLWVDTNDNNKLYRAQSIGADQITAGEWVLVSDLSYTFKNQTFAQASIPVSIQAGDMWVDTDDGNKLYRAASALADAIIAGEWVLVQDAGIEEALGAAAAAQETADGEIVGWYQATQPATGMTFGDIWIDIDDSPLDSSSIYRYQDADGGSQGTLGWRAAATNAIGMIYLNAYSAQTTADGKIKTFYQTGIPTSTDIGDLWVDTDDANKLYRAAIAGANEIKAGEWESARDTAYTQKTVTFAQATVPVSLAIGDLWVDTDANNKLYRAESIGADQIAAGEWVLVQDTSYTSKNVTFAQDSAPTSLAIGDLWIDTNDQNKLYRAASIGANEIKAGEWEIVRDLDINSLLQFQEDTSSTLSYFGITDTTLIEAGKVYTGMVSLDTLLSGMGTVTPDKTCISLAQAAATTITLDNAYYLREIRTVASNYAPGPFTWPAGATYFQYKLEVSADNTYWKTVRPHSGTWAQMSKNVYTMNDGLTVETAPSSFILDGTHAKYIKITFDKFYNVSDQAVAGNLVGYVWVYGSAAAIHGGAIFANTIELASLDEAIRETITNFDNRNDQDSTIPSSPSFVRAVPDGTLNSDGTISVTLSWDY